MGMFDDLVPAQQTEQGAAGGLFDDLIPPSPPPAAVDTKKYPYSAENPPPPPKRVRHKEHPTYVSEYIDEAGRAVARGATNFVGQIYKGASAGSLSDTQEADSVAAEFQNIPKMDDAQFAQFYARALKLAHKNPDAQRAIGESVRMVRNGQAAPNQALGWRQMLDTRTPQETAEFKTGQAIQDYAQRQFPQAPEFKDSWTSTIAEAGGSTLPYLATALAGPLSLPLGMLAGIKSGEGEALDRALQHPGTTNKQVLDAATWGAIPGATEQLPIEYLLRRIPVPVANKFGKLVVELGKQAFAEGGQEAVNQLGQNLVENYVYNPDKDLTEGVLEAAGIGAIVGGTMQVAVDGGASITDKIIGKPKDPGTTAAPGKTDRQTRTANTDGFSVQSKGQRIEPRLFDDLIPETQQNPASDAKSDNLTETRQFVRLSEMDETDILRQTGYSLEQIADMNPAERAQAAQEARQQGIEPIGTIAPGAPPVGTSATAPGFGTRKQRASIQTDQDMAAVRPVVNAQPSEAQAAAGNYQKGHINLHGLDISIENPKGSVRRGTDPDTGEAWQSPSLPADYGYVKGTKGKDGDHVDVYIGPNPQSDRVYVIDQVNLKDGKFDEHKAVLAANSPQEAVDLYVNSFDVPTLDRIGDVTEMSVDEFKAWSKNGRATKRPAGQIPQQIQPDRLKVTEQAPVEPVDTAQSLATADKAFDSYMASRKPLTPEGFAAASGLDVKAAGRAIQRAALAGRVIQTRSGKWVRAPQRSTPINAVEFIASLGGIQDVTGELAGMDLPKMTPYGPVVRKTGLHPDKVREALVEAGYLQDAGRDTGGQAQTTADDVYQLLDAHLRGQKAYSVQDQAWADDVAATKRNEQIDPEWRPIHPVAQIHGLETWEKVQAFFADSGTSEETWSPQEVSDAARLVAGGMDAGDAFERAAFLQIEERSNPVDPEAEFPEVIEWMRVRDKDAMELFGDMPPFPDVELPRAAQPEAVEEESNGGAQPVQQAGSEPADQADVAGDGTEDAGTGAVRGEEAGQDGEVDFTDTAAFKRIWKDPAFQNFHKATKDAGVGVHRESPVAVEMVRGWAAGRAGAPILDQYKQPYTPVHSTAANPLNFYLMAYWFAERGVYRKISASQSVGVAAELEGTQTPPTTESGADNKPQLVIPGAEQDVQGAMQNAAKKPLKASKPQKDMDIGLFGDSPQSPELFDAPQKPRQIDWKSEGETAFKAGKPRRAPIEIWQAEKDTGAANKNAEAWYKGWDKANLAEPLPQIGEPEKPAQSVDTTNRSSDFQTVEETQSSTPQPQATERPPEKPASVTPPAQVDGPEGLVQAFRDFFGDPTNSFATITEARKFASERGFEAKPGTPEAKDLDERLEQGLVLAARDIVKASKARGAPTTYSRLVDLYGRQPNLGVRTSESMADQAYSTPAPLAYIASRLAGVSNGDVVYEPTAGNGMLLIEAAPETVIANELNERRRNALKAQGFKRVTGNDASLDGQARAINNAMNGAAVVIENPPFGVIPQEDGTSKNFHVDGWKTTQIDHAIALTSLKAMRDDGRAVLIVGSVKEGTDENRSNAYNSKQKREFYYRLYKEYKVTDHFTVAGDLYKRQGAGWPVDVIVIEGRGKSERKLPAADVPKLYDSWDALKEKLANAPAETQKPARPADGGGKVSQPADFNDAGQVSQSVDAGSAGDQHPAAGGRPAAQPAADDDAGTVSAGRPDGQRSDPGEQQSAGADGSPLSPGTRDISVRDRQPDRPPRERVKREQTDAPQQSYQPMSSLPTLDTKIPTNMADAVETSLDDLAARHGDLDSWIETELGYGKGELKNYLAAEQVDAVAMALDNVQKGAAFIIGDQTGIGKGRVVASALRYAMRKGLAPVFVTEKPNLYGDIIRDMNDIGIGAMLGRDLRPFLTNSGISVPLDDDAVAWFDEAEKAKTEGQKQPAKRGKFLRSSGADAHKKQMAAVASDGLGPDKAFDIVFTTYDQMNTVKGDTTDRRRLIGRLAGNAFVVLDESHNAGGTDAAAWEKAGAPQNRSDFLKEITGKAKAVMFSSATYAKRPQTMALYARTDMGKAVEKPEMLGELIARGGVPMQQVVASMLAKAGQYIRRERSFDGVAYDVEPVPVDEKAYESVSTSLARIAEFDNELKKSETWSAVIEKLKESAEAAAFDSATGGASVTSTNFTSLMHNIVGQMLLAIKADSVATRAIDALKNGEKPVITVANTMGAFLKSYAEEKGIRRGDDVNLSFQDVLRRYLDRTLRLTVKNPDGGESRHVFIPIDALPSYLRRMHGDALDAIRGIDTHSLPISPIDWMRHRIQKAGYRIAEITGRKEILEYGGPDNASFSERLDSEVSPAGRRVNIDKFNRGDIDVMILNRAGSTGLSLHASQRFKDQRRRRMIIAQAELNIDVHMQMLGRVHRTGQVVPPAFSQAYADVPAEARPAAVLAKKMASLNANTTAARKSAFSADDGVDFLNQYGDQVAREFLAENPDMAVGLDIEYGATQEETARVLTGKILLLPIAEQKRVLDEITTRYKLLIENLDAMGENALEAKTIDLKAKTISRDTLKDSEGDSPFTQAVTLEEIEVKASGKALPIAEVVARAAKALTGTEDTGGVKPASALNELERTAERIYVGFFKKWVDDHQKHTQEIVAAAKSEETKARRREQEAEIFSRFRAITDFLMPGKRVNVRTKDGEPILGVVMEVKRRETGATGNPLALGAWSAEIAIPDNAQRIIVPFSSIAVPTDTVSEDAKKVFISKPDWAQGHQQTVEIFENARKEGKETRFVVTGNILAGFDQTKGQGQIINYTDDQGNVKPGILMNKQFSAEKFKSERAVRFKTATQVVEFIVQSPSAEIKSRDNLVTLRADGREYEFELPAGRGTGGTYFLNPAVRTAASDRFVKVGSVMRHTARDRASAERVLQAMMDAGALFQTTENQDVAEQIIKGHVPQAPLSSRRLSSAVPDRPIFYSGLLRAVVADVQQAAQRILGHHLQKVMTANDLEPFGFSSDEDGVFDPNTGVIYVALQGTQDPRSTVRHEAIHGLRQAGVFTKPEWAALSRMAASQWIDQYNIRDRYEQLYRERFDLTDAQIEELLTEEAVADAFADYMDNPRGEGVIARIFEKLRQFLAAVRNALKGQGFTTASQVFGDVDRGVMGRRDAGTGTSREFMLYGRQGRQAPLSSRGRQAPPRNPAQGTFDAPHDERVREALFDSTDTLLNRIRRAASAGGVEFRRKVQDREIDLLRTQGAITKAAGPIAESQDAYLAASLYPGRVAQRDRDLVSDVIEPLVEDIARRGLTLDEVDQFNRARHAFERNIEIGKLYRPGEQFHDAMFNPSIVGGSGLSDDQASDILNAAQQSGRYADLEAVGDKIVALNAKTLDSLLAEGLIEQEQYDALKAKYRYYVPLRGHAEATDDTHPDSPRTGSRYDIRGKEFQQAYGRTSEADSTLAYSILQARQAIVRIEKNRVGKRFLRLAQANPNEAFWQVNRKDMKKIIDKNTGLVRNVYDRGTTQAENVYAVKVGGKAYHVTIHHTGLLRAMKGIGAENMHGIVVAFYKINRFLAGMNTSYDPEFIFRNLLRDLQQTGIVLQEEKIRGLTRNVLKSMPKAAAGMNAMLRGDTNTEWSRYARDYADAGGKMGFMGMNDIAAEKASLERLMKEQNPSVSLKAWMVVRDEVVGRLDRYNDSIENTLRLATYVHMRKAGVSRDKAASAARELTVNFNRKGEWSSGINAFYMFFNAATQGGATMAMRLARSKTIRRVCFGIMVTAFLQDMLNRMLAGDDDDGENRYDKIPDEIKAKNGIIMLPKALEEKYGVPYLKWPLPLGYNMFHIAGTQVGHAVAGARSPLEAAGETVGAVADAFNPLGTGGTLLNFFAPTLLDPAADIATNTDYFGEDIMPRSYDDTQPNSDRYKPNIAPWAKAITDFLNEATGGSPERKGAVDWSPEWVEHIFDFAAGGVGRLISRSSTVADNLMKGDDVDANKVPFARVFTGQSSKFTDRDTYNQIKDAVHVTEKEIEARKAEGDTQEVERLSKKYGRELRMIEVMKTAERQMTKLRKDYRAMKGMQGIGEKQRKERLDAISRRMDAIQLMVRQRWNSAP